MLRCRPLAVAAAAIAVFTAPLGARSAMAQAGAVEAPFTQELDGRLTIRADRTSTLLATQRFKILTQSAIATVSQQKLTFVDDAEVLITDAAYTEKPGGRRIPVPPGSILTQDAATGQPL